MKLPRLISTLAIILSTALLIALSACSDRAVPGVQPCPCAGGAFCCSSGVCAASEDKCGAATAALSLLNEGTWTGYVENVTFASGTDNLRVSLNVDSGGGLTGRVTLGGVPTPAPPTDPEVGWPDGYLYGSHAGLEYAEGFAYEASNIRWESLRLRMQIATNQAWQDWCALQTSYLFVSEQRYLCVPPGDGIASLVEPCTIQGDPPIPVDCGKLGLCWLEGCTCDESGCMATDLGANIFLDVALADGKGNGSIRLGSVDWVNSRVYNVRLVRTGAGVSPTGSGGQPGSGGRPESGGRPGTGGRPGSGGTFGTSTGGVNAIDAGASDGAECVASDAVVAAACAPTYDEQVQAAVTRCGGVPAGGWRAGAGPCDTYLIYWESFSTDPGKSCYYDGMTRALVGYEYQADTGIAPCFGRSFAGQIPDRFECRPFFGQPPLCPQDAGSDGP